MRVRSKTVGRTLLRVFPALALLGMLAAGMLPAAAQTAPGWQAGPDAVLDNTYVGFVDQPAGGATIVAGTPIAVSGWVVDRSAQGWAGIDDVQVYNGAMGQGGTLLAHARFAQSRPDVAQALNYPYWAASGFFATIPAGSLGAGPQTLNVYAHTPAKGWWFKQVSFTVSQTAPTPNPATSKPPVNVILRPNADDNVSIKATSFTVKGYAYDPAATPAQGTGIDRVEVYMDELRGVEGTKFIGEANLQSGSTPDIADRLGMQFVESGYQIDFNPSDFKAGNHHIYVYAHSSVTGLETVSVAGFNMFDPNA